jgi:hypothetical protein
MHREDVIVTINRKQKKNKGKTKTTLQTDILVSTSPQTQPIQIPSESTPTILNFNNDAADYVSEGSTPCTFSHVSDNFDSGDIIHGKRKLDDLVVNPYEEIYTSLQTILTKYLKTIQESEEEKQLKIRVLKAQIARNEAMTKYFKLAFEHNLPIDDALL